MGSGIDSKPSQRNRDDYTSASSSSGAGAGDGKQPPGAGAAGGELFICPSPLSISQPNLSPPLVT